MRIPQILAFFIAFGIYLASYGFQFAGDDNIDRGRKAYGRLLIGIGIVAAFCTPLSLIFGLGLINAWNAGWFK